MKGKTLYATTFKCKPPIRSNVTSKVRMSSDKWSNLDKSSKALWDRLDDKAKATILGYNDRTTTSTNVKQAYMTSVMSRPSFNNTPSKDQVNLHDFSAYDFILANMLDVHQPVEVINDHPLDSTVDIVESNEHDNRLIHAAKSSGKEHVPPGDICRGMSQKNTAPLQYNGSYNYANENRRLPLIDRGAKGGVAGEDVRDIFCTGRTVDIKGIDNHRVNDIAIGTVDGVVNTQHVLKI